MKKKWRIVIATVLVLVITCVAWYISQRGNTGKPEISPETTFVDGPIDEEGYVDYISALNNRLSSGVTPENNGGIEYVAAIGPVHGIPFEILWRKLVDGKQDRPEGPFLSEFEEFHKPAEGQYDANGNWIEPFDVFSHVLSNQWNEKDYPEAHQWLVANEKPLELIRQAVAKERFYIPVFPPVNESNDLLSVSLEYAQRGRSAARALNARALWHLKRGEIDLCQQDLLTNYRLGRHFQHNGTLIGLLVGVAICSFPTDVESQMLEHPQLTDQQLANYQKQLDQLPPPGNVHSIVDHGERMVSLSAVQTIHRGKGGDYAEMNATFDINVTMKRINEHYDWMLEEFESENPIDSEAERQNFESEWFAREPGLYAIVRGAFDRHFRSRFFADTVAALLIPAIGQVNNAHLRVEQQLRISRISIEIERYKKANGKYPDSLDTLFKQAFFQSRQDWKTDVFSGKDLRYFANENGFLLYTVGINGIDQSGLGYDDNGEDYSSPPNDDVSFRVRFPKQGKAAEKK